MIETPRLRLRPLRTDDFAALHAMAGDPDVMRYLDRAQASETDTWRRLLSQIGHVQVFGYAMMAAEERETGRVLGQMGFIHMRRGHGAKFDAAPEAGWTLARFAQGQGYAREGMEALLSWLGARRTVCMIDPENVASLKLAARLGYRAMREALYGERPVRLLERLP